MAKAMFHEPNLATSRYTDLRHEPITRLLIPIIAYYDKPQVSLEESIEPVSHLFNGIEGNVWVAKENSKNPANGLTSDESASIQLYTMQFDPEPSLYEVLNKALCDENRQSLKPWNAFLKLFLTGLLKIPSCTQTVWRGVRGENLSSKYPPGSRFAWWGVSSCTAAIETLENDAFLGRTGLRTLFSIECKNGKPVEAHSYFKKYEKEVILIPGSYFEVVSQLNPATDLYIIHLREIDPPFPLVKLPFDITPLPTYIKKPSDNQIAENRTFNVIESLKKVSSIIDTSTIATSQEIIMPYSSQLLSATLLHEKVPTEGLIKHMKSEEQRMEKKLEFMQNGAERIKYEIRLMKYREMRIEQQITILKRYKAPIEGVVLPAISFEDEENSIMAECERLKNEEEHMEYEIKRMEQHKIHLENEIRSMKYEIERVENRLMVIETNFRNTENYDELHQIKTRLTNSENEPKELTNREMRLEEHLIELKRRKTKLEEHRAKQLECQIKLNNIRDKIKREKERIQQEIQLREDSVKRLEYYHKELKQLRAKRIKREAEFSKTFLKHMSTESEICKESTLHLVLRLRGSSTEDMGSYFLSDPLEKKIFHSMYVPLEKTAFVEKFYPIDVVPSIVRFKGEISGIIEQPKYDIFISNAYQDNSIIERIKNALPQWYAIHSKSNFSSRNIKTCLDNTNKTAIAIINKSYEIGKTCQADMIHIFKRQFPLVLVISDNEFKPSTDWLNLVWNAPNTQKVFLNLPNFEQNLRNALENAQWNLSPNLKMSNIIQSNIPNRFNRFSGDLYESIIDSNDPVEVSENYRQLITDPLLITTDIKLRDFYYNYIRMYFENSDIIDLFEKGVNENDMRHFIRAYTSRSPFNTTLNSQLAANVRFYFESKLYDTVDYQLVKSLIDFVALSIYRPELQPYLFNGTVHRGVIMSEEDLLKYVVGSRIINNTFLSTSKDKQVAEFFSGKGQQELAVIFNYVIHNKNNRRTALDISTLSFFPHEREVLILPFSTFHVKSVVKSPYYLIPIEITLVEDDYDIVQNVNVTSSIHTND